MLDKKICKIPSCSWWDQNCTFILTSVCVHLTAPLGYSQFVRAESGFLESSSIRDVLQNLMILNTRIGTATQTEHLPTCYTIWPLSWGRAIKEGGRETERAVRLVISSSKSYINVHSQIALLLQHLIILHLRSYIITHMNQRWKYRLLSIGVI